MAANQHDAASVIDARTTGPPAPILIVDDNTAKRLALKAVLTPLGYRIVEADSGVGALRCVLAENFAVILLDIRMPVMDGFETAERIRMRAQSEATPIIFITAYGSDEIVNTKLYAEGAVDFMFAPVRTDELRAKVSSFVRNFATVERRVAAIGPEHPPLQSTILDLAPAGVFHTDAERRYVYTNQRWTEITGVSRADAAGTDWASIAAPDHRDDLDEALAAECRCPGDRQWAFDVRSPDSTIRGVVMKWTSMPPNGVDPGGFVGTLDASNVDDAVVPDQHDVDHDSNAPDLDGPGSQPRTLRATNAGGITARNDNDDEWLGSAASAVVDLEVLERLRALGRDVHNDYFVPELVEQFAADTEVRLVGMRAAVDGLQLDALGRLTHALKGAACQLGGCRLVAACVTIEDAVEADSAHDAEIAYKTVEREYESLRIALLEQAERAC